MIEKKRSEIRKEFKSLGYKVSFQTNPLKDSISRMSVFSLDDPDYLIVGGDNNVFDKETLESHPEAVDLFNHYTGNTILTDTNQRLV